MTEIQHINTQIANLERAKKQVKDSHLFTPEDEHQLIPFYDAKLLELRKRKDTAVRTMQVREYTCVTTEVLQLQKAH